MREDGIDARLSSDYEGICAEIESVLEEVLGLFVDPLFRNYMGENAAQDLREDTAQVRKRLYGPFQLTVLGDFKRGKSTLINALLGTRAAPTAATPETVTINRISFSETPSAEAVLENKKRARLSLDELERGVLEGILEKLPAPVEYIDVRLPCEMLRGVTVVDTPGTGDLTRRFDEQAAKALVSADAVIYVVSARSPLSASEQAFLSAVILPQSFSRILLAINMADTLETEENIEKVKNLMYQRIGADGKISIFALSALDEFCRKTGLERPQPALSSIMENNFMEFEQALQSDVIMQRDVIKSSRGLVLTRALLERLSARITLVRRSMQVGAEKLRLKEDALESEKETLYAEVTKQKEKLAQYVDEMESEASKWMNEFLARLKKELEKMRTQAQTSDIQRYVSFYLTDCIQKASQACILRHQRDIRDLMLNGVKEFSNGISQSIFGSVQAEIAGCIADISWTKADTAVFAGDVALSMSGLSAVLGPVYLVGQAIAGAIRQREVSKGQADLVGPLLQNFGLVERAARENIKAVYAQMKKDILIQLDETYQQQIELSMEAAENVRKAALDENVKAQDVFSSLDLAEKTVKNCMQRLQKL